MPETFIKLTVAQLSYIVGGVKKALNLPQNLPQRRPQGGSGKLRLRHFELNAHMPPGGTAAAFPRDFDGTDSYVTDTGGTEFDVHDMLGIYRGRKRGAYSSPHDTGSRGIAQLRNGIWQIISMQPHALTIEALTNGAVLTSDAIITIDTVKILNPIGAILAEGLPTQVENTFSDAADTNAVLIAVWDDDLADDGVGSGSGGSGSGGSGADGRWKCIAIECPA